MPQKHDGIAIKLGDEKFDIWHEAVQTKGRDGAVQVVQAEASNEEMPHQDRTITRPKVTQAEIVPEVKIAPQIKQPKTHHKATPPEPLVSPHKDQIKARYLTELNIMHE